MGKRSTVTIVNNVVCINHLQISWVQLIMSDCHLVGDYCVPLTVLLCLSPSKDIHDFSLYLFSVGSLAVLAFFRDEFS